MDSQDRGWMCGASNGEGLSRVLAADAYPPWDGWILQRGVMAEQRAHRLRHPQRLVGHQLLATDNPFPLKPDLLFYARSAGIGQLYATNLAGDIGLLSTYTDWRTTWTLIVPMHFSGARHSDVLFYNAAAGLGELYSTNGLGELNPIVHRYTNWRTSWSIIVAGSFTGTGFSDLLLYDRAAGTGEFYRTDEHGNLTFLTGHTDWLTTWSQIVVGNDPHGTMTLRRTYEDWRTDWSLIHTGNFADHV
jgi:hypothetical protein